MEIKLAIGFYRC